MFQRRVHPLLTNVWLVCLVCSGACAVSGRELENGEDVSSATSSLGGNANLIANPSVESVNIAKPTEPLNWKPGAWGTNTTSFTYPMDANTGSCSIRIDTTSYTSGDAKWVFDAALVIPGTQYVYRDYYKSNVVTKLVAAMQQLDGTTVYQTLGTVQPSSAWASVGFSLTPPTGTVRVTVYHLLAAVGWLQLDDARFAVVETPVLVTGVPNGSLEQSDDFDPTRPLAFRPASWGTNTVNFTYDTDAHAGSRAIKVSMTAYSSGDAKWIFNSVPVTPGVGYVYRDFYKSNITSKLVAVFQLMDGSTIYQTLVAQVPASAAWAAATNSFVAPANAVRASVYHLIAAVGTLQLDDLSLLPTVQLPDLRSGVPNGSLEQMLALDPSQPLAWHTSSWGTLTASFSYATDGHTGSRSVSTTVSNYSSGDAKWYFDPQPVTPGTRYLYSDYYTATAANFVTVRITRNDGSLVYLSRVNEAASTSYAAANVAFVAPTDAMAVTVFHGLAGNGTLTVDDAALVTLPPTPLVNGVPNGNLEQEVFPGAAQPAAFYPNVWGTNNAVVSYDNTGHSGNRSVRVQITSYTSGSAAWYFDAQPVNANQVYQVSEYYRSDVDTSMQALVKLTDGSTVYVQLPVAFAAPNWTPYSARLFLPRNAQNVTLYHQLSRVGSLSIDDVGLVPVTPAPFQRGLVTLTFDDSWVSDYNNVLPVLNNRGVPATHYVITGSLGQTGRMDLAMLATLQTRGDEIAAHTVTHPDITTLSSTDLNTELLSPKQLLEANGFGPVTDFASPYGAYGAASLAAIQGLYLSHRTVDAGENSQDDFDAYRLRSQSIRQTTTTADVDTWAARAAAQRTWLIVTYHDVVDSGGSAYSTTPAGLDAQVRAIQSHGLTFVTVAQALAELRPQL